MSRRYRVLAVQVARELGSQRKAARRVGCPPSSFSEYHNGIKHAESLQIERAVEHLGVSRDFFSDPSLGDKPDYRRFIMKGGQSALGDLPKGLERWAGRRAAEGRPVSRDHILAMARTGFAFTALTAWDRVYDLVVEQERGADAATPATPMAAEERATYRRTPSKRPPRPR